MFGTRTSADSGAAFRRRWRFAVCVGHAATHRARPTIPSTFSRELDAVASHGAWYASLSPREREVATLVTQGLTNKQIAERLVIAPRTAENHLQRVFDKLGVSSRAQVAAWVAVQHLLARGTPGLAL